MKTQILGSNPKTNHKNKITSRDGLEGFQLGLITRMTRVRIPLPLLYSGVVQWLEFLTVDQEVVGSIPIVTAKKRLHVLDWRAGFRLSLYKNEGSNPSGAARKFFDRNIMKII